MFGPLKLFKDELSAVSVSRCNMSLRAFWLKHLQTSRQHILNAQVSRNVNIYAAVFRSRSSGLTGQTTGQTTGLKQICSRNRSAHLHSHRHVFAQRLLRQSRVERNLHHGEEETWASWRNEQGEPGDGGPSFAASACDAVCNLVFDQSFRSLQKIRTVAKWM